jgi:hypothetical protein
MVFRVGKFYIGQRPTAAAETIRRSSALEINRLHGRRTTMARFLRSRSGIAVGEQLSRREMNDPPAQAQEEQEQGAMIATLKRTLAGTVAAVCFAASFAANAAGVFYQSDFDPFTFIVKNILWVNSTANSDCLSGDGWTYTNSAWNPSSVRNPGCTVSLYSSVATLNSTNGIDVAYIDFVRAPTAPSTTSDPSAIAENIVLGIYLDTQDNLAGVLWAPVLIGPEYSTTANGDIYCAGSACLSPNGMDTDLQGRWKVQFVNDPIDLLVPPQEPPFDAYALLFHRERCSFSNFVTGCYSYEDYAVLQTSENNSEYYGDGFRFVGTEFPVLARDGGALDVPEPGSLALLGGALVAGWYTRRRKVAA